MKLCYIDLETTGTKPYKHAIHQIAGFIEIDNILEKEFEFRLAPHEYAEIDPKALEIAGVSEDTLHTYEEPDKAFKRLRSLLSSYVNRFDRSDKFYFIAYNAHFDDSHLRALWQMQGDKYYGSIFSWPPLDVAQIAAFHLLEQRDLTQNFKLETVCQLFELPFDSAAAHDALYDIRKTRELFLKLKGATL